MKTLLTFLTFLACTLFVGSFFVSEDSNPAQVFVVTALVLGALSFTIPAGAGYLFDVIPIQDARNLFTKKLIQVYDDSAVTPTSFFTSFFRQHETRTKNVSIEVIRGEEYAAVDVWRGGNGNRNTFDKSVEKIFTPPMYYEYFLLNESDLYDNAIGRGDIDSFTMLVQDSAAKLQKLKNQILRAIELQCAQALETGVVQLNSGVDIDYGRQAGSLVDSGAGTYWATSSVNPYNQMEEGGDWIREKGKYQGSTFNVIMGRNAFRDFMDNIKTQGRADILRINLDQINMPQRMSTGASLHGKVACGAYTMIIWTYDGFYKNKADSSTIVKYMHEDKILMLPETTNFDVAYAMVPQLIKDGQAPQTGAWLIQEFTDEEQVSHKVSIKAAPLAILTAVDQVYTRRVVAA